MELVCSPVNKRAAVTKIPLNLSSEEIAGRKIDCLAYRWIGRRCGHCSFFIDRDNCLVRDLLRHVCFVRGFYSIVLRSPGWIVGIIHLCPPNCIRRAVSKIPDHSPADAIGMSDSEGHLLLAVGLTGIKVNRGRHIKRAKGETENQNENFF